MISALEDNVLLDNYIYSTGVKAYGDSEPESFEIVVMKSDTNGNFKWIKHYGNIRMDLGWKITKTFDNNIIIAASRCAYPTSIPNYHDCQTWILKLDTAGNIIWQKDFGHPDLQDLRPFGLIETQDSCYIITGGYATQSTGAAIIEDYKGWILKIDRNGNEVWSKLYGESSEYNYTSIIKEKNNKDLITVYNLGWHDGYHTAYDPIIQCLSPTGEIKWFRPYYFNGDEYADQSILNTFDFTNDGGYVFAGYGQDIDSTPATRSWVIKTDSLGFDGTYYNGDTTLNVSLIKDTICYKDSVLLNFRITGKSAPYSITLSNNNTKDSLYYSPLYEPYINDSLYIYPTDSFAYHNFTAIITDAWNNSVTVPLSIYINSCYVGITEQTKENFGIRVYPNPASTYVQVESKKYKVKSCLVYDIYGRTVNNSPLLKGARGIYEINISTLPKGIYFIKILTNRGIIVEKFVKN